MAAIALHLTCQRVREVRERLFALAAGESHPLAVARVIGANFHAARVMAGDAVNLRVIGVVPRGFLKRLMAAGRAAGCRQCVRVVANGAGQVGAGVRPADDNIGVGLDLSTAVAVLA